MNRQINITKTGTTTLATAGKYCDRNIDVNVTMLSADEIVEKTVTEYRNNSITTLDSYVFRNCAKLTTAYIPNLTSIGTQTFYYCITLENFDFSSLKTVGTDGFRYCYKVNRLAAPIESIAAQGFQHCLGLYTLILRPNTTNTVATLANINAFNNTPIEKGTGYIYVPDALVASYKTATNWSTYANQIKPISELGG